MADFESMMEGDGFTDMEKWLDYIQEQADLADARTDAELESGIHFRMKLRNEIIFKKQNSYYLKPCPKTGCKGRLVLKITKAPHRYFWSCTNYPTCRCAENFYQNQQLDANCKSCGANLIIKFGSKGAFVGCKNYPKCKFTDDLPYHDRIDKEKYSITVNNIDCKIE